MATLLVLTNLPDRDSAFALAHKLIDARLAACVNILSPCTSVYRWQQKIEAATEVPLFIKTEEDRYYRLEQAIREAHPYELPEIVAVRIGSGLPEYLQWVAQETRPNK
jgi:periplasmic divalent cation tolerance protein